MDILLRPYNLSNYYMCRRNKNRVGFNHSLLNPSIKEHANRSIKLHEEYRLKKLYEREQLTEPKNLQSTLSPRSKIIKKSA